ncbi:MAG: DNA alkylation repair protein, partial [Pseudobutyrivibrio sp.]|nr:DNA alkylation repair protein [Pseudobutyrivibrio sp.]
MIQKEILDRLYDLQDLKYKDFSARLVPNISSEYIVGVRLPQLRKLAKEYATRNEIEEFLQDLPHKY